MGELREVGGGEWGPLRWLEHDGVAGRERRADAPGGEHERRIPGRDDDGDTGRVPSHVVGVAACLEVWVLEVVHRVVREVADVHDDAGHDAAPVRAQQRAVVVGLELGELLDVRLDVVGDPVQDRAALGGAQCRPCGERRLGRGDGRVCLGATTAAHMRDDGSVDRRDALEGARRGHPMPADPVPGVDFDTGHDGSRHSSSLSMRDSYAEGNLDRSDPNGYSDFPPPIGA